MASLWLTGLIVCCYVIASGMSILVAAPVVPAMGFEFERFSNEMTNEVTNLLGTEYSKVPVEGGYVKTKEEKAMIMKECNETNVISPEFLESLNKTGKFPTEDDTSRFPMCFIHCMFDKYELIDGDGVLNAEGLEEVFKSMSSKEMPDMREMVDKCIEEQTVKDVCEKSYGFIKCLLTEPMSRYSAADEEEDSTDTNTMTPETVQTIKRTMQDVGSTIISVLKALTSFQKLYGGDSAQNHKAKYCIYVQQEEPPRGRSVVRGYTGPSIPGANGRAAAWCLQQTG